jgi:type VI secretion system secreted protein Hcp
MDLILLRPGDPALFPGRDGGSVITTIPDAGQCIELVSLHQGMKQQVTTDVSNSARTSGRPIITEFTCVKYVDQVSVKLYDYCLRAKPLGEGKDRPTTLYIVRNSGDQATTIMTFALRDALISEIQFQSHPDDMPTEQFKLNFTEILWSYGSQAAAGWSLARNRPIAQFTA